MLNKELKEYLLILFLFSLTLTDIKFHPWISIYTIVLIFINIFILYYLFEKNFIKNIKNFFFNEDLFLFFFLLYIFFQSLFLENTKTNNYLLAYSFVFIQLFFIIRTFLINFFDKYILSKYIFLICFLVAFLSLIDFISLNFFEFEFLKKYNFLRNNSALSSAYNLVREKWFFSEPIQYGQFFLSISPIGFLYLLNYKSKFKIIILKIYSFLILTAIIISFSTSIIICLIFSLFFTILFNYKNLIRILNAKIILFLISAFLILLFSIIYLPLFEDIKGKLILDVNYISVRQRLDGLFLALTFIQNNPIFGVGMGYHSHIGIMSPINWFIMLFVEAGFMGLILVVLFFYNLFLKVGQKIENNFEKLIITFSLISIVLHHFFVSTFFYPNIWFLLASIYIFLNKNSKKNVQS